MLAPLEIKNKTFKGSIGYNKKEVDSYMNEILKDYEALYSNVKKLEEKNDLLANNLSSYKTIEKQLEKSLVLANKAADEVKAAASADADVIRKNAENEAEEILRAAREKLRQINEKIDQLATKYESYKASVKSLAQAQIDVIDSKAFYFSKDTTVTYDDGSIDNVEEIFDSIMEDD